MMTKDFTLTIFLGPLVVGAIMATGLFLFSNFGERELKILFTTMVVGIYSLFGLCISALYEKKKFPVFVFVSTGIIFAGFIYTLGIIWGVFEPFDDGIVARWTLIALLVPGSLAQSSLLLMLPSSTATTGLIRGVTLVTIGVVAVMLVVLILRFENINEFYYRLLGVLGVLDVLGTIAVPIYAKTLT